MTISKNYGTAVNTFECNWKFSRNEEKHFASETFSDAEWASVDLPHDWAAAGPFSKYKNTAAQNDSGCDEFRVFFLNDLFFSIFPWGNSERLFEFP